LTALLKVLRKHQNAFKYAVNINCPERVGCAHSSATETRKAATEAPKSSRKFAWVEIAKEDDNRLKRRYAVNVTSLTSLLMRS
jgi:hypothetical protein